MSDEQKELAEVAQAIDDAKAAEAEAGEEVAAAEADDASGKELESLRGEKASWAAKVEELEKRLAEAEEKARRVVPAPKPKAEKKPDAPKAEEKPRRARVSSRWFGEAAYSDD